MSTGLGDGGKVVQRRFYYGWVVVATSVILMALNATILNGFGVFFKPLAADFGWSRAATSGIQSLVLISTGVFSVPAGLLADRFGANKILAICSSLAGLGLMLTSRVSTMWQIYLTYSLMTGVGLSTTFSITGTATARWFVRHRGLVLGIVASGVALGNLVGVPAVAHLIAELGWSRTYFILGIAAFTITMAAALLLSRRPRENEVEAVEEQAEKTRGSAPIGISLQTAARTPILWLMFGIFFAFTLCSQMVTVHLVNYATDLGTAPLVAATLISGVGLSGVIGRILMGMASDRIGNLNILLIGGAGVVAALLWLVVSRQLWMLYLFSAVFGFSHGSEVPQQTALTSKFFGLRVVLVGIVHCGSNMGGALGSWLAGRVFDVTQSYQFAFLIGVAAIVGALGATLALRHQKPLVPSSGRQSTS